MGRPTSAGTTLLELLIVLTLLGVLAGVVGLTMRTAPGAPAVDPTFARIVAARDSALRTGHPVTIAMRIEGQVQDVTAMPDGRVVATTLVPLDPLTGVAHDTTR